MRSVTFNIIQPTQKGVEPSLMSHPLNISFSHFNKIVKIGNFSGFWSYYQFSSALIFRVSKFPIIDHEGVNC